MTTGQNDGGGCVGRPTDRLAEILERMGASGRRLTEIADELAALSDTVIDDEATALAKRKEEAA
ncbi:MAG: hypothetical protein WDZ59_05855 [Pirellulales bacterium]